MLQVAADGIGCGGIQRQAVVGTALTVLSTYEHVEGMVLQVELVVQGVGGAPAPSKTYLVGSLVGGAHVTLVVDLIGGQVATPAP